MNNKTFKVAFCGMICALAVVMMLCTGLIPVGTYAFPCLAGMMLTAVVVEFGEKWAYGAYAVVAVLSLILAADKEAALYFTMFFGFYPILKSSLERLKSKAVQYILKFSVFNVCIIGAFLIAKFVLMIPDEEFTIFGFYIPWMLLIIGNLFFVMYDKCVSLMVFRYVVSIRNKIFK